MKRSSSTTRGTIAAIVLATLVIMTGMLSPAIANAVTPFPICIEMGGQAGPEIAGNMVVWTDNRNGNLDIYGRNVSSSTSYAVCTNDAQQDNPAVTRYVTDAGKVRYIAVWVDKRNHASDDAADIYGRNITTGTTFVVSSTDAYKWYPDIVDKWVVWIESDTADGPYRIKARDLVADKSYLVGSSKVLSPVAVDKRTIGDQQAYTVVWTSGGGNISGRDLPTGTAFSISRTDKFEWMPDISQNRVVWWEAGGRVMLKNLKTGKRTFVHLGARPRVFGQYVVWDDGGKGGSFTTTYNAGADIFVRDVSRNTTVARISQADQTCLFPAVSSRRVVWESGPAARVLSHIHIYGAKLP